MKLAMLKMGQSGVIIDNHVTDGIKTRLRDIGFICGNTVECVGRKSCRGPYAYLVKGSVFVLRQNEAGLISVKPV